jgi:hypothetical protein
MGRQKSSRRAGLKVAQYEVLGWRSEKATRPGRGDRRALTLGNPDAIDQELNIPIVPGGTDIFFCLISEPRTLSGLGYFQSLRD